MLLDGSEMDSFADLTHTPQGDVKNEAMFSLLPKFKNLTHTPQGDVSLKWPKFFLFGLGFNPHPARGRKGIPFDYDMVVIEIQLTPRKGTEAHPGRQRRQPGVWI